MKTAIKNCGLRSPVELDQAARTGASFVGFVHHPASPRHLALPEIAALAQATTLKRVVVMVDPSDRLIDDVVTLVKPDYLQVHGIPGARAMHIAARSELPLILGIAVRGPEDLETARTLEPLAAHILLDNKESGSGEAFDWTLLAGIGFQKPWFLAGGLTPENVAQAIRLTRAPMVDVSSGIEDAPGKKSLEKIAAFNKAVLNASHG
jgi:phosphoribosylanthranilate isomerase